MADFENLLVDEHAGVRYVTLNRPEARNAVTREMTAELEVVVADAAARRGALRVVVFRGAGGNFCAGGDLKLMQEVFSDQAVDPGMIITQNRRMGRLLTNLVNLPQVTVAVVEGAAMGGGVGLAAAADVVLTAADARFSTTETTLGLIPAQIAAFVLDRVGLAAARRLMVTGLQVDGAEAQQLGLADVVAGSEQGVEEILDTTLRRILRCAPEANAVTKELLRRAATQDRAGVLDWAAEQFAETLLSEEVAEGVAAFLQQRRPAWIPQGRH